MNREKGLKDYVIIWSRNLWYGRCNQRIPPKMESSYIIQNIKCEHINWYIKLSLSKHNSRTGTEQDYSVVSPISCVMFLPSLYNFTTTILK